MNRKTISILILFSLIFSFGLNSIYLSMQISNTSTSSLKNDDVELKKDEPSPSVTMITGNFALHNTDIFAISTGTISDPDRGYFNIWYGGTTDNAMSFYWYTANNTNYASHINTLRFRNRNTPDSTNLNINHLGENIFVYNDSDTTVPYDNAYSMNSSAIYQNSITHLDEPVFSFAKKGDVNYLKANPGLNIWKGIKDFESIPLYETKEKGTSVLHFGVRGQLVVGNSSDLLTTEEAWNQNVTADYYELFHFSAKNGVADLKWDFFLGNITYDPSFIAGYNINDLRLANVYYIGAMIDTGPGGGGGNQFPANYSFAGSQIQDTHNYLVNTTNLLAGEMDLGIIDFGTNYTWNEGMGIESNETVVNTILHNNQSGSSPGADTNVMYLTQSFNNFAMENISFDPQLIYYFLRFGSGDDDDDDDDDDEKEDLLLLYIIIGIACAGGVGGAVATVLIIKRRKKRA